MRVLLSVKCMLVPRHAPCGLHADTLFQSIPFLSYVMPPYMTSSIGLRILVLNYNIKDKEECIQEKRQKKTRVVDRFYELLILIEISKRSNPLHQVVEQRIQ